jgi:hypothetical protein
MRVNALYSCPYLNQQKPLFLPIIAYTLSTTTLEIRVARGEGWGGGVREGEGGKK